MGADWHSPAPRRVGTTRHAVTPFCVRRVPPTRRALGRCRRAAWLRGFPPPPEAMSHKQRNTQPAARPMPATPVFRLALPPGLGGFDWGAPDVELRLAQQLASMAASDFEAMHQALRFWMAVIPRVDRRRLVMPFGLWDRLYPPGFLAAVSPGYNSANMTPEQAKVLISAASSPPGGQMTEIEHILFEMACGLREWAPAPAATGDCNDSSSEPAGRCRADPEPKGLDHG